MTLTVQHDLDCQLLCELLLEYSSVEATVLYGSVARGDIESHSDIDLLLLCSEGRKLSLFDDLRLRLESRFDKLSITIYSKRELAFLSAAKSLFLLHLSREGKILFDKLGFLSDLLRDFQPKPSYRPDFEKSLRLADPLRCAVWGAPNNLHRLSYLYSLFRVFGVYLLAERGIYEFSKSRMVQLLCNSFPGNRQPIQMLSRLRPLNSNFFVGGVPGLEPNNFSQSLPEAVKALGSMVGTSLGVELLSYSRAVDYFEAEVGGRSRGLDYRLRMWFLLLAYDGFNLYCKQACRKELCDLAENSLLGLTLADGPDPIVRAAQETIKYIHRYPLKYFLDEESKISSQIACYLLRGINDLVGGT
jgi:predicted nucleotidyltransferase